MKYLNTLKKTSIYIPLIMLGLLKDIDVKTQESQAQAGNILYQDILHKEKILQPKYTFNFSEDIRNSIYSIFELYSQKYDIKRDSIDINLLEVQIGKELENGMISTTLAIAGPGEIAIDTSAITTNTKVENIISHEIIHAIAPDSIANVNFYLQDGAHVYGIQGFRLLVILPTGKKTKLTLIEEAACESIAYLTNNNYIASSPNYYSTGSIMIEFIKQGWITEDDIFNGIQNNDLIGTISKILNIQKETITVKDIEFFITMFNQAFHLYDAKEINDFYLKSIGKIAIYRRIKGESQ